MENEEINIPAIGEFRHKSRKWKWKYTLYKRICLGLALVLSVVLYLLIMALKGNYSLQRQLEQKPAFIIQPNGRVTTLTTK